MRHPDDGHDGTSGNGASANGPSGGGTSGASHPDEGVIHSWLDGELSDAEARALTAHLEGCADCRDAVAEARGLVAASARIVRALDDGPGGVHALPAAATPAARLSGDVLRDGSVPVEADGPPAPASAGSDVRSIDVARSRRPAGAPRRWRLPAIAAVGLMAVGTTLVLQRGGPPAPLAEQGATAATDARSEAAPAAPAPARAGSRESSNMAGAPGAVAQSAAPSVGAAGASGASGGSGDMRQTAPAVAAPPLPPQVASGAVANRVARGDSVVGQGATALSAPTVAAVRRFAPSETAGVAAPPVVLPPSPDVARAVGPVLSGRVVTTAGEPLASARVTLPGVAQAAMTDSLGRFRLSGLPAGEHVALVQRIGYEQRRLPLHVVPTGDSVVTVALKPAPLALDEMIVTGTVLAPERSRLGAAVAKVSPAPAPAPASAPQPPTAAPPAPPAAVATPGALVQRLAGCYRLELGGEASAGRDSAEVALPGWLHLLAAPSARRPGWLRLEPLLPSSLPDAGTTGWRLGADDEVEVVWPAADADIEVVLRLRGAGEVLAGTAALRRVGSGAGGEREAASVVAFRGACAR